MPATETQRHLYELIADFRTAMLVSRAGDTMHVRPMAVADLRRDADAYFATSIDSPKIAEMQADAQVLVTFQSNSQFASIAGTATVVRDRALIDRLWSDAWRVWFPAGKDDPLLCLIKVDATEGEYWDTRGARGLRYLFNGVSAVLQGTTPATDQRQHAKVSL
jgi:general stress protein 26